MKLKPYDDLDLIVGGRYGPRPLSPSSPIPPPGCGWGLDSYGLDGVNPAFMRKYLVTRWFSIFIESIFQLNFSF